MEDAINKGVLCKYMYYPHLVQLTRAEMDAYAELSDKIAKYFNFDKGCFDDIDEKLKMLLLARKRIVHKAERKLDVFKDIIENHYQMKGNLKYTSLFTILKSAIRNISIFCFSAIPILFNTRTFFSFPFSLNTINLSQSSSDK